jgi:hypothetical protein
MYVCLQASDAAFPFTYHTLAALTHLSSDIPCVGEARMLGTLLSHCDTVTDPFDEVHFRQVYDEGRCIVCNHDHLERAGQWHVLDPATGQQRV